MQQIAYTLLGLQIASDQIEKNVTKTILVVA